jgi:hypothetical protein
MKIYLFNTAILTGGSGNYRLLESNVEEWKKLWSMAEEKVSAIGHEATAKIFSVLLGEEIAVNRIPARQEVGEIALVLKVKGRIPEGIVLKDISKIEKIGYDLYVLNRTQ